MYNTQSRVVLFGGKTAEGCVKQKLKWEDSLQQNAHRSLYIIYIYIVIALRRLCVCVCLCMCVCARVVWTEIESELPRAFDCAPNCMLPAPVQSPAAFSGCRWLCFHINITRIRVTLASCAPRNSGFAATLVIHIANVERNGLPEKFGCKTKINPFCYITKCIYIHAVCFIQQQKHYSY